MMFLLWILLGLALIAVIFYCLVMTAPWDHEVWPNERDRNRL